MRRVSLRVKSGHRSVGPPASGKIVLELVKNSSSVALDRHGERAKVSRRTKLTPWTHSQFVADGFVQVDATEPEGSTCPRGSPWSPQGDEFPSPRLRTRCARSWRTQWHREPAVRLDSTARCRKDRCRRSACARTIDGHLGRADVWWSTQTNEQSFDVARRFATRYPSLETTLFVSNDLAVPRVATSGIPEHHRRAPGRQPSQVAPPVTIANAWKWAWVSEPSTV